MYMEMYEVRDLEFTKNEKTELIYDIIAGILAVIAILIVMMELSNSFTEKELYYIHIDRKSVV